MQFDPANKIVQLCARGVALEATQPVEAQALFLQAWQEATTDVEKCIAAHYVARFQPSVKDKLTWDETALLFALQLNDNSLYASYPSLYLNIAKCYEDMGNIDQAQTNYAAALSYAPYLPEDGYGQMILAGIKQGMERLV